MKQAVEYAIQMKKEKIQIDTQQTNLMYMNYITEFYSQQGNHYSMGRLEKMKSDTVYVMRTTEVKEEFKDKIKATFINYVVITQ